MCALLLKFTLNFPYLTRGCLMLKWRLLGAFVKFYLFTMANVVLVPSSGPVHVIYTLVADRLSARQVIVQRRPPSQLEFI